MQEICEMVRSLYLLLMNVITDPEVNSLLFSNSLRFCYFCSNIHVMKFDNICYFPNKNSSARAT